MGSRLEGLARYSDEMSAAVQSAVSGVVSLALQGYQEGPHATVFEVESNENDSE